VKTNVRAVRDDAIRDHAWETPTDKLVASSFTPSTHEVVSLIELSDHLWNLFRIVLKIAIERDNDIVLGVIKSCGHRGCLAEVAPELNKSKVRIVACRLKEGRYRGIARAVINVDDLVGHAGCLKYTSNLSESLSYVLFLVINWNYDRYASHIPPWKKYRAK
jgi:hypothetical protein